MKKTIYFLWLMHTFFQGISQIFISGEVANAPKDVQSEITFYNNPIEWIEISAAKIKLDSTGKFTMTFNLNKATSAKLIIADEYTNLFLVPNDSIHVTVDYSMFDETIHYFGRGAADNNYLAAEFFADFGKKANRYGSFNDADKFKLFVDSLEKLNNEFLKANDSPEFTKEFRNYINAKAKYLFINPRWMYQVGYDKTNKRFFKKPVPENYFDFLKTIDLDDELAFDNSYYHVALRRYLSEMNNSKPKIPDSLTAIQKKEMRILQNYNFRKSIFKNKVLDYQLTTYLKSNIGRIISDKKFVDELIKDYKSVCKNPEYISIIDKVYSQANKLSSGNSAPDFTLLDSNSTNISLSSLKGKIVFIDFWATWCAPCIVAMPRIQELMVKFKKHDDIVFLFVNVNDNQERWKNYISKEKLGGVNVFADKKQSNELYESYNFSGIPHYVLIDKEGKLIEAYTYVSEYTEKKIVDVINK